MEGDVSFASEPDIEVTQPVGIETHSELAPELVDEPAPAVVEPEPAPEPSPQPAAVAEGVVIARTTHNVGRRYAVLDVSDVSVALSFGVTAAMAAAVVAWSQYLFSTGRKLKP